VTLHAPLDGGTVELSEGVRLTTLPSGVKVVTEAMPDVRSVSVGFWVDVGSRDERGPVAGATHFLEHLLFKGTQRRSALEIAEALDAVGGDLNAFTSKEFTCFYARCLDRDLPLAVDVLGDMITSATMRPDDVESERQVVLEEISIHLDTPDDLVHSVWHEAYFADHPLGREVLGDESTITAMSAEHVAGWYRRQYVPANLVVAAAGNLDHDHVVEQVVASLARLDRTGDGPAERTAPPGLARPVAVLRARPTEQAHIVLGGRGIARGDERRFAAGVLNQALGGGMASRLFQEVRERRGLAYTVYSYQGSHTDTGTFAVYAGTAPGRVDEVLTVIVDELGKARAAGITEAELERAKGNLAGSVVLALEDTGSRMNRIGKAVVTQTPLQSLDETLAAIEAVTLPDVAGMAELFCGGPLTLAVVGSFDGLERPDLERYVAA
jgi:predicted Zn-dependent peptidase